MGRKSLAEFWQARGLETDSIYKVTPPHQSINQFIYFPSIQLHGYQLYGYRNGQRILYKLLLITVSVNKLGILLIYIQ
jgi:hypothetical protein